MIISVPVPVKVLKKDFLGYCSQCRYVFSVLVPTGIILATLIILIILQEPRKLDLKLSVLDTVSVTKKKNRIRVPV